VFIPLQNPPAWMDALSNLFPVRHFADALVGSFLAVHGSGVQAIDLVVVGVWGIAGLVIGVRFFSWEPRV
jgi:ABC-2 type transport system permease protein